MKTNPIGWLFAAAVTIMHSAAVFAVDVQPEADSMSRPPPAIYMGIELLKSVELSLTPVGNGCKPVPIALDRCIGPLCLGASPDEVERLLGKQLTPADDGQAAARYEYDTGRDPFNAQLWRP
jgi:hypothetical protein